MNRLLAYWWIWLIIGIAFWGMHLNWANQESKYSLTERVVVKDSLWSALDSIEKTKKWKKNFRQNSTYLPETNTVWVSSVVTNGTFDSVSLAKKFLDISFNMREYIDSDFEPEVTFSVEYNDETKSKKVEILYSSEPDLSFEKELMAAFGKKNFFPKEALAPVEEQIDALKKNLLGDTLSQENVLEDFSRFVAKIAFFKVSSNIKICRKPPEDGNLRSFCDVSMNDSLSFNCFRIVYLTYHDKVIAFKCSDGNKTFREDADGPWNFDLFYDAPYKDLKKIWLEQGLDVPETPDMSFLEKSKNHL